MSGGGTICALLTAALKHKLTSAEWAMLAVLLCQPNYRIRDWDGWLRRQQSRYYLNNQKRQVALTDGGLRKALLALEARGWVSIDRDVYGWGQHPKILRVSLLCLMLQEPIRDAGREGDRPRNARRATAGSAKKRLSRAGHDATPVAPESIGAGFAQYVNQVTYSPRVGDVLRDTKKGDRFWLYWVKGDDVRTNRAAGGRTGNTRRALLCERVRKGLFVLVARGADVNTGKGGVPVEANHGG